MNQLVPNRPLHVVALQNFVEHDRLAEPRASKLDAPVVLEVPALSVEVPVDVVVRNVVDEILALVPEALFGLVVPTPGLWWHPHYAEITKPILPGELVLVCEVALDFRLEVLVTDQEVGDLLRHDERRYAEPREPQEHHQQG